MDAGPFGRLDDLPGRRVGKPGDVVANGSGQELDHLGDVPHVAPEIIRVPDKHVRAVQAHGAPDRLGHAEQQAQQGRFPRPGGPGDAQQLTRIHLEGQAAEHRLVRAFGDEREFAHHKLARRLGQEHLAAFRRRPEQGVLDPAKGHARDHQAPPHADGLLHRRQGPAQYDGGGDHRPDRELLADHEQGRQAEDEHLEHQAHELAQRHDQPGAVAGHRLEAQGTRVLGAPPPGKGLPHAHPFGRLRLAHHRFGGGHAAERGRVGIA